MVDKTPSEFERDIKQHPLQEELRDLTEMMKHFRSLEIDGDKEASRAVDLLEERHSEISKILYEDVAGPHEKVNDPRRLALDQKWRDLRSADYLGDSEKVKEILNEIRKLERELNPEDEISREEIEASTKQSPFSLS